MKRFVPFVVLCIALFAPTDCLAQTKTTAEIIETVKALREQFANISGIDTSITPEQYKESERIEGKKTAEYSSEECYEETKIADENIVPAYTNSNAYSNNSVSYEQPEKPIKAGPAFVEDPSLRPNYSHRWKIQGGSWKTHLDGHAQIADANDFADINSRINFGDNINFDKETAGSFRATFASGGKTNLELSYSKQEHKGVLNVAGKVFDGVTFNANAKLRMKNEWIDFAVMRKLARSFNREGRESGYINGIFGIKTNMLKADVKDPEVGGMPTASADWDKTVPVPYLGLNLELPVSTRVFVKSDIRYFKLNYDDYDAKYRDFLIEAVYRMNNSFNNEWFLNFGYRNAKYDVNGKGDDVLLEYKGPIMGIETAF